MHPKAIIHSLVAAALLGLPSAALAAPDANATPAPHRDWHNSQQQNTPHQQTTPRQQNTPQQQQAWQQQHASQQQQNQVNGNNRGVQDDQRIREEQRARDAQRSVDAQRAAQINANNGYYNNGAYNGGYNGAYNGGVYNNGNNGNNGRNGGNQLSGVVSAFSNFNLQLNNRQNVILHQGTVINPTGTTIQPGMQVQVFGRNDGNGQFEADTINVVNGGQYNQGSGVLGSILRGIGL